MHKYCAMILCLLAAPVLAAEQCETNFTKEGSFFKGKTFKTWALVEGTTKNEAFKKVYLQIAKDGWNISNYDKDIGVITAGQEVSYGKGKTAPFNVIVEEATNGVKISVNYSLSGGVSSPEKAVISSFCQTISAAKH